MIGSVESFEQVALPVCAVNYHHRIVAWNAAAEEFFGLEANEALGREWHSVIHTTGVSGCCALCATRRSLRSGGVASPVQAGVSVEGYHQRATMVPVPLSSGIDQLLGFMFLTPESTPGMEAPDSCDPVSVRTRVQQLDEDRIIETLTGREREVLACVVEGYDARTIAETVGITHATARNYVQRILTKLGARNKVEAVRLAFRYNLLAS